MNIEENIKILEKYVKEIESESVSIDAALTTFEKAIQLAKESLESITAKRGRFEELTKDLNKVLIDKDE